MASKAQYCGVDYRITSSGCWIPLIKPNAQGYVCIRRDKTSMRLHRYAWEHAHRRKTTMCVLHRCDVRACFNPEHLFEGTQKDNMQDKARKRRVHNARFTREEVVQIRLAWAEGRATQCALALNFKCTQAAISAIIARKNYGWI